MRPLNSLLQEATAENKKQLLVLKEFDTGEVVKAVEDLARQRELPVQRIDLSTLVSRYIGETEKNLQRVLEEAKGSGAILFFEESNALFGKRTGVKDAHDRYANRKLVWLLQRLEAYNGLIVVAVNRKSNIDKPFLRRLRPVAAR